MKEVVAEVLKKALAELKISFDESELNNLIEVPVPEMGDFAFPCFVLLIILIHLF